MVLILYLKKVIIRLNPLTHPLTQFDVSIQCEQDVSSLQVSVDDLVVMQIQQSIQSLFTNHPDLRLRQRPFQLYTHMNREKLTYTNTLIYKSYSMNREMLTHIHLRFIDNQLILPITIISPVIISPNIWLLSCVKLVVDFQTNFSHKKKRLKSYHFSLMSHTLNKLTESVRVITESTYDSLIELQVFKLVSVEMKQILCVGGLWNLNHHWLVAWPSAKPCCHVFLPVLNMEWEAITCELPRELLCNIWIKHAFILSNYI